VWEIHNYIFRPGFESDIFVGNGLIDMSERDTISVDCHECGMWYAWLY
jgi:hypothetical protein